VASCALAPAAQNGSATGVPCAMVERTIWRAANCLHEQTTTTTHTCHAYRHPYYHLISYLFLTCITGSLPHYIGKTAAGITATTLSLHWMGGPHYKLATLSAAYYLITFMSLWHV